MIVDLQLQFNHVIKKLTILKKKSAQQQRVKSFI